MPAPIWSFTRAPAPPPGPASHSMSTPPPESRRAESEIGPSIVLKGDVSGEGSLVLRGRIEGRVTVRGEVLLAEEGRVIGEIESDSLVLLGEITGSVRTARRLEIGPLAALFGDFETPCLRFHKGGRMRGRAKMLPRSGGEKD